MAKMKAGAAASAAGAVLVFALALAGCGGKPEGGKEKAEGAKSTAKPALTVSTTTPQKSKLPVMLAANGNLVAWQEASVGAEVPGLRIEEVRVNVGDSVKQGDVLATFNADAVRADVAQARANLAQAEASAAEAEGNAQRARRLQGTGALSTVETQQLLTGEKTAHAKVLAAQAALQAQEVRFS